MAESVNTGTLEVSVVSPTIARPSAGAAVSIRNEGGAVVFAGVTDAEGRLPTLTLPTPPEELSLTPSSQPEQPFSGYDVTVVGSEGDRTDIQGVQLYTDTTALLPVALPGQSDDIDIPLPSIIGDQPEKIPEAEEKPLPLPEGTVVLPQPVIPEFIIVHGSVPSDSSAPDYYVGFQDYIKNVASSEIFATWPREAIKANVLAILSFTLNRVFTEWYRGKGYSFTITNSTAYDQAFIYGRNFFTEIADVVDEVFTLYITRPDMEQPLLAQYCDGIRVNRSGWLSQWGSKELADRGYSAVRILQSYYGRDIIIREAQKVEGVPVSFSGTLSIGSRGQNVRTLQRQLNRIAQNYPLIPRLAVDGIYGEKTAASVRTFQQIFNMPRTGITDFATWYRISDIYVAVARLAE